MQLQTALKKLTKKMFTTVTTFAVKLSMRLKLRKASFLYKPRDEMLFCSKNAYFFSALVHCLSLTGRIAAVLTWPVVGLVTSR